MAGREVEERTGCASVVYPELDGDCASFISHHYTPDGRWLHSETFVGYESDESIAESRAFWEREYWDGLEADSDRSFA
jgi:hypothetical protein